MAVFGGYETRVSAVAGGLLGSGMETHWDVVATASLLKHSQGSLHGIYCSMCVKSFHW